MAYAGLDVGTSGCKMVVYDLDGKMLCSAQRGYDVLREDGRRTIDPKTVARAVFETITQAAQDAPESIEAFAITALGESSVPVGEGGKPLYPSMAVGDVRGDSEKKRLCTLMEPGEIMQITGLAPTPVYSLSKWMWINENTDVFKRTEHLFLYEDYIGWLLTGKRLISYSAASRTMAFDIRTRRWSEKLLKIAGLRPVLLSAPVPSGTIIGSLLPEMAAKLGLAPHTLLVAGGHDQGCAALGAGVISKDVIANVHGSCEALVAIMEETDSTPYMLERDLVCVPHVVPGAYVSYLVQPYCGVLSDWTRDTLFPHEYSECKKNGSHIFAKLDGIAGDAPSGLLVLPHFGASGTPCDSYDARGVIWGLTVTTRPEEIYRGILEGMAYQMRMAFECIKPLGIGTGASSMNLIGGGSASALTLQLRADVFNMPVNSLKNKESGTLGAMLLAAHANGAYPDFDTAVERAIHIDKTYYPDPERHKQYHKLFEKYQCLYQAIESYLFKLKGEI